MTDLNESDSAVRIEVVGGPPIYDPAFSISNPKHPRHGSYVRLKVAAKKTLGAKPLLQGDLTIKIVYHAQVKGLKGDSANIIGGIANALESIIYPNDKQLREIHYLEMEASEERYSVMVRAKR